VKVTRLQYTEQVGPFTPDEPLPPKDLP